jgi:hypothetical protein
MKKLAISIVSLFVLLGGCAIGGTALVQSWVESEIEQAFTGLRAVLAKADHGAVTVNLWDRSVRIADVVLVPRAAPATPDTVPGGGAGASASASASVRIAGITAAGIDSVSGVLFASRVEIDGLIWTGPSLSNAAVSVHTEIPRASVEDVSFNPRAVSSSPHVARAVLSLLGASSAKAITVPLFKLVSTAPVAAGGAQNIGGGATIRTTEQVHTNTRIRDLQDGKIAAVMIETTTITTSGPADLSAILPAGGRDNLRVAINASVATDLDLGMLVAMVDHGSGDSAVGLKRVLAQVTTGRLTVERDGDVTQVDRMVVDHVALEPAKVMAASLALRSMLPQPAQGQAHPKLSPKQEQAMLDRIAMLYEHVHVGKLEINGFNFAAASLPTTTLKFESFQLDDFQSGKLGQLTWRGVDLQTPAQDRLAARKFELKGLNLTELIRLPGKLGPGSAPPPPIVLWPQLLRLLNGVEIDDLQATNPQRPMPVTVDQFKASWGQVIGQTPTSGEVKARLSMPAGVGDPEPFAALARGGIGVAKVRIEGSWSWHEPTKTMNIGPVEAEVAGMGAIAGRLTLANVARSALIARPDFMPASIQEIALGQIDLTVRDAGLLAMIGRDPALNSKRQQLVADARTVISTAAAESAGTPGAKETGADAAALIDGLAQLVARPNSRLTLKMTPKTHVTISRLVTSGKTTGHDLALYLASQFHVRAVVD